MACVMILFSFQAFAANKDYYEILGVARTASHDDIKKAYRKLIRRWHPDLNPEISAEQSNQKSKEINEAWEVLGDDEKRSNYDEGGFVPQARPKSKLEEAIGIVARHRSDTREWREKKDLGFLAQFTTDEQIDALRAAVEVRKGSIFRDYSDLLKFNNPQQVEALKILAPLLGSEVHYQYSNLLDFKSLNQVEALRIASEHRQNMIREDVHDLLKFDSKSAVDALKVTAPYLRGGIRSHYADFLKFDDPQLVDRLKSAIRLGGRHFSFNAFFKDELSKATQAIEAKVSLKSAETLIADLEKVQPQFNLERQALSEFVRKNQSQIFKLSLQETQLKELEKISGLSNLITAYQKFRAESGSQLDLDAMYKRLEAEKDKSRDRAAFDEIVAQAVSPAQKNALNKFLIRNPLWIAQINQSGEQLRKLLEEKGYAEDFRREIAAQYLKHSKSLSDYFSLTGLSGPAARKPWRNLIAVTVGDFLRLEPDLADIQRVLKVKGLGAAGLSLAAAAIDKAETSSDLRSLELPADYADSLDVKNRFRSKLNTFGKAGPKGCFTKVSELLRSLVKRSPSSHND